MIRLEGSRCIIFDKKILYSTNEKKIHHSLSAWNSHPVS